MFALRRTAAMMTSVHRKTQLTQTVFRANFAISAAVGSPCLLLCCPKSLLYFPNFGVGWVDNLEKVLESWKLPKEFLTFINIFVKYDK